MKNSLKFLLKLSFLSFFILVGHCGIHKKVDTRVTPQNSQERAVKNVNEGRGISVGNILGNRRGGGSFEFSSSNPLWRASLEILDFLPLTTVDYSGGIIITDWYTDSDKDANSLKITVRFLNNEIASNSLKIIVHQKKCLSTNNCTTQEINSKIKEELTKSILTSAATIEAEQKAKK
jgi:hypothetical protein